MKFIKKIEINFVQNEELIEINNKDCLSLFHLERFKNRLSKDIQIVIDFMIAESLDLWDIYDACKLTVKVRELKGGESGDDLHQIHTDYVKDYNHPNKQETHLLYTNTGGTRFYNLVNGEYKLIGETEPNSIYKYNREYHQSPIVESSCKRVMIRLSFVDRLK